MMAENCLCKTCTLDSCFIARGSTKTSWGSSSLVRTARNSGQLFTETQFQLHVPVLNKKTLTNGPERFRPQKVFLLKNKSSASSGCSCISNLSEEGAECVEEMVDAEFLRQRVSTHGVVENRTVLGPMQAQAGEGEFGTEGESAAIEIQRLNDAEPKFDGRTHYLNEKQQRRLEGDVGFELGEDNCNSEEKDMRSNFLVGYSQNIRKTSRRTMLMGASISGLALKMYQPGEATAEAKAAGTTKEASWPLGEAGAVQVQEVSEKGKGSRIYDATVLGEPVAVGKDKARVWQKLLAARVVYLGEAERVPDPDDKVLELEIVRTLRDRCFEQQRPVSLAMQEFPCTLQPQLNQYMSKRLSDSELRALVMHWSDARWKEYQPLLQYCRNNGVRLMACGTPLEVLRTVQAKGVQGLSNADQKKYVPPVGGGFALSGPIFQQLSLADVLPNASVPFGPGPFHFAQARIVEDFTMSQVVIQAMADGGSVGLLVVIVGSSHILFGSKGAGLPARISKKLQKRTQAVVLLNPERQRIRKEGDMPEADFLWYSAAKPCIRNCFDRAEVARVMDAAGRRRDALPKDIQTGLDLGLVSPDVLKDFFDLEKQPFIAELTHRFQGFRERWFADPRFLQRLVIEETISITTTLIAQYERRKERFVKELDYVITDTVRGAVVDFFTVWLPAPTLSFRASDTQPAASNVLEGLKGLLGLFPDNAFQRATAGENWDLRIRVGAVILGGVKLFSVGVISSISTLTVTNTLLSIKERLNPQASKKSKNKRSPIFKTAFVYGSFLGLSANLRYQAIAGIVEHWIADYFFASQPLAGNILSFVARTANSYWGTQQWVDLARFTGLQAHQDESQVVPVQSDVKPDMAGETFEFKASLSEIAADSFDSKTISWEIPAVDHVPSTVEEDQVDERTENSEMHGN